MEGTENTTSSNVQKTKRCLHCGREMSTELNSDYCTMLCEAASIPFSPEEAF